LRNAIEPVEDDTPTTDDSLDQRDQSPIVAIAPLVRRNTQDIASYLISLWILGVCF